MVLEVSIEKYLYEEAKRHGGRAVKLHPTGAKGIPDRLVILPDAIYFAETKRPKGGVLDKLQVWWQKYLTRLGHTALVIRTKDDVDDLFRVYRSHPSRAAPVAGRADRGDEVQP
jgi:hypothetical protein